MSEKNKLLEMLKIDLGITARIYDVRLVQYIEASKAEITREGVQLKDNLADNNLVVQYAAWMWRKRDTGAGMPRMIRWQLNNRIFEEKKDG